MNSIKRGVGFALVIGIVACAFVALNWESKAADNTATDQAATIQATKALRIGVFDSRALALAHGRSAEFMAGLEKRRDEHAKAKEEGNEKLVKKIEAEMPATQDLMHKQVFSTWPVDNILEKIEGQIPEIAKEAKVDLIINKWDIVYQGPGVEFVDVNELMVKPFKPDEMTLQIMKDLLTKDPLPIEEVAGKPDK